MLFIRFLIGVCTVILLIVLYWQLKQNDALTMFTDVATMRAFILEAGFWAPVLVIGLLTVAIIMSPLPSAPIALASGALFGHVWGTIYVIIGSLLGAIIAFSIARLLGHDIIKKRFGDRLSLGLLGSQNALMLTVCVSRLIPFISFDVVSYAAGITVITFWRFAIATFVGIIPASFLLAHFGSEMVSADTQRITITVILLGGITSIPLLIKWLSSRKQKRSRP